MSLGTATSITSGLGAVPLRGEAFELRGWVEKEGWPKIVACCGVILLGTGLYGATMGWWRAPLQGCYVALKFPLIVLMTTFGNALLNGMLAPLLGVNIPFRQSLSAILLSFAIASAILGSLSPLMAFVVWNVPAIGAAGSQSYLVHSFILLLHVATIAFAGIIGNVHLGRMLTAITGSPSAARKLLLAWLAGNLFLGSQVSWILRPFIGSPGLPIEFVRQDALRGNFFETVGRSFLNLLNLN